MDRDGGKEDIRMYVIRASFHLEFDSYVQEIRSSFLFFLISRKFYRCILQKKSESSLVQYLSFDTQIEKLTAINCN